MPTKVKNLGNTDWAEKMDKLYMQIELRLQSWTQRTSWWHRFQVKYLGKEDEEVGKINTLIDHYNFCHQSKYINPADTMIILHHHNAILAIEENR
jgi:hypothetical protein